MSSARRIVVDLSMTWIAWVGLLGIRGSEELWSGLALLPAVGRVAIAGIIRLRQVTQRPD